MTQKAAVILVNLGTPEAPTPHGVKRFLTGFLSDPRVVEAPRWLWWLVLRCIIIPLRLNKVVAAYQRVWTEGGSPLREISEQQAVALQKTLNLRFSNTAPKVVTAATYGQPSIPRAIAQLQKEGVEKFIVVPMYPQYSGSTTAAIYDQLARLQLESRNVPDVVVIKHFYDRHSYIEALAFSVKKHWEQQGKSEKLLMSFHGVPKEYVDKGDPYAEQCHATAAALADYLGLAESQWLCAFQSRFGPKEWLKPYADQVLCEWAKGGVSTVDVISPAFTADCLETLEELDIENRKLFLNGGGKKYSYIPCLNADQPFIEMLAEMVSERR